MNTDFRVAIGFFRHRKTRRLKREAGDHGIVCLLKLFCFAAESRPDGRLTGLSIEDIEDEVEFEGEPGDLYRVLHGIGWLDEADDVEPYAVIHDWERWNSWAAGADARSEKARRSANIRHHGHPDGVRAASGSDAPLPSSPLPSSPPRKKAPAKRKPVRPEYSDVFDRLWAIRRQDPGETGPGSKAKAWAEWRKLSLEDMDACGFDLDRRVSGRLAQHELNLKVGARHEMYRRLENLPHLYIWIKEKRWE